MKEKIIYSTEQFERMGFDGEIALFMRQHVNSEIKRTPEGACVVIPIKKQ